MDLQSILLVLVIGLVVVFGVILSIRLKRSNDSDSVAIIKQDLVELARSIGELDKSVSNKVDKNNQAVQHSVSKQLSESRELVRDISEKMAKFEATNKRVGDVADELKTLQNVLSNPKQRGVFGEVYLESVLENVLPVGQYSMQYKFKDGEIVDAVIFLDKGKILPIDSKFSLENYNRMVEAKTKDERDKLLAKVKMDLKGRIDETSKYIRPSENTMDFAFMFIPSESLYYDQLIGNVGQGSSSRDLI
jgi:DNA recombination protein RmuC